MGFSPTLHQWFTFPVRPPKSYHNPAGGAARKNQPDDPEAAVGTDL